MPRRRFLKGFTLVEISVVLIVLSMIAVLAARTFTSTEKAGLDSQARTTLISFAAAQALQHDTMGFFISSPEEASSILASSTYVTSATASDDDTEISFKVASVGGFDYVAAATLSASGRCFFIKTFEPSSPTEDLRKFYEQGEVTCNADSIGSLSRGQSW